MEYAEFRVFDLKQGFLTQKQGFRIFCIKFCVSQNTILTQYGKYGIRKKMCSEFCKNTKIRIYRLSKGLKFQAAEAVVSRKSNH